MTRPPLPPKNLRMGGVHFRSDQKYIAGGVRDVRRLVRKAGLREDSRLLDWGCGAGRLAVGITLELGHIREYHGVDVQEKLVRWAAANLADEHTRFTLVDQHNARYNPAGRAGFEIPSDDGSVDVFYGYSVFSHMVADDVAGYSRTIAKILSPDGRVFLTAFVEDGVPDFEENPEGYLALAMQGPLHCVRFNRPFFEALLLDAGLGVEEFIHGRETDGQSLYILKRRA
jgi:cyclopropane fatty-acyl-phospholipid synthase-like methyltransferase